MGGVKVLGVDPATLKKAADGINGVISGISGGAFGSYQGQLGRGFEELSITGLEASHPDAKSGFDNFTHRWEWGTRALIVAANDIGEALDLGAGRYELQEKYYNDAAKDMVNDLAGDPSLQKESVKDEHGNIVVRGTDDMGWGEMVDYNVNRLTHPDWSAESFEAVQPQIQENWNSIQDNALQAGKNAVIPGEITRVTVDGFLHGDEQPAPSAPAPRPVPDPAV
ncbi:Uncharacterised protein [Mycolicibacterium fortuitum]|uniref:Uncharacterized protein n=1 Tax=Mycolicibacterium fortuitum TaxID=1766 RepID=A0A378WE63_MYCFO|nr:Uncharacterised protein [Mycolicibacterium fortuitum]